MISIENIVPLNRSSEVTACAHLLVKLSEPNTQTLSARRIEYAWFIAPFASHAHRHQHHRFCAAAAAANINVYARSYAVCVHHGMWCGLFVRSTYIYRNGMMRWSVRSWHDGAHCDCSLNYPQVNKNTRTHRRNDKLVCILYAIHNRGHMHVHILLSLSQSPLQSPTTTVRHASSIKTTIEHNVVACLVRASHFHSIGFAVACLSVTIQTIRCTLRCKHSSDQPTKRNVLSELMGGILQWRAPRPSNQIE